MAGKRHRLEKQWREVSAIYRQEHLSPTLIAFARRVFLSGALAFRKASDDAVDADIDAKKGDDPRTRFAHQAALYLELDMLLDAILPEKQDGVH